MKVEEDIKDEEKDIGEKEKIKGFESIDMGEGIEKEERELEEEVEEEEKG